MLRRNSKLSRDPMQLARYLGLLLILLFLIWSAGRTGFASLLSAYAARTSKLAAARSAAALSPRDPAAHLVGGAILEANDDVAGTTAEYQQAVSLRPQDYLLWLNLAQARELNGDISGAIAAA